MIEYIDNITEEHFQMLIENNMSANFSKHLSVETLAKKIFVSKINIPVHLQQESFDRLTQHEVKKVFFQQYKKEKPTLQFNHYMRFKDNFIFLAKQYPSLLKDYMAYENIPYSFKSAIFDHLPSFQEHGLHQEMLTFLQMHKYFKDWDMKKCHDYILFIKDSLNDFSKNYKFLLEDLKEKTQLNEYKIVQILDEAAKKFPQIFEIPKHDHINIFQQEEKPLVNLKLSINLSEICFLVNDDKGEKYYMYFSEAIETFIQNKDIIFNRNKKNNDVMELDFILNAQDSVILKKFFVFVKEKFMKSPDDFISFSNIEKILDDFAKILDHYNIIDELQINQNKKSNKKVKL